MGLAADAVSREGYAVVDGVMTEWVVEHLGREVEKTLNAAFGNDLIGASNLDRDDVHNRAPGIVLGHYVPMMSSQTPVSLGFAQHPPLTELAKAALSANDLIAKPAKGVHYLHPSQWHRDAGMEIRGVKAISYIRCKERVFFEVIPGSHRATVADHVEALHAIGALDNFASVERIELGPEQLLLFDVRLWHRNVASTARTQWSVTYMPEPHGAKEVARAVGSIGSFFGKHPSYDASRFPFYPSTWLDGTSTDALGVSLARSGVAKTLVRMYPTQFRSMPR